MGQKDLLQKQLLGFPEVFADIINVLIFGEEIIKPEELEDFATETVYGVEAGAEMGTGEKATAKTADSAKTTANPPARKKRNHELHSQFQDICKIWRKNGEPLAILKIENQTREDKYMVIRVMNYDSARYLTRVKRGEGFLPQISLVLHYGRRRWRSPKRIREFTKGYPEEIRKNTEEYKIRVVDVAYLPKKIRQKFRSDFGFVADFLVGIRMSGNGYALKNRSLRHPREVLEFLGECSGDDIFREYLEKMEQMKNEKGEVTMNPLFEEFVKTCEQRGEKRGEKRGERRGERRGKRQGISLEKIRMAKALLNEDEMSEQKIASLTELSLDQIHALKAKEEFEPASK